MTNIIRQLEQELQNELTTSNHLLRLMKNRRSLLHLLENSCNDFSETFSLEIQRIKEFTNPGGEFEASIQQNASLVSTLARIQHIDIENLPPIPRTHIDLLKDTSENMSYEQHDSFREHSNMDDTQ